MLTCNTGGKGELQRLYLFHKFMSIVKAAFLSKGSDYYLINLEDTNYNIKGIFVLPIFPLVRTIHKLLISAFKMAPFHLALV